MLHGTNLSGLPYFTKEIQATLLGEALKSWNIYALYVPRETWGCRHFFPIHICMAQHLLLHQHKTLWGPQTVGSPPQSSHHSWQGWTTWKASLYCFQSCNIYSVGRIFLFFSKNNCLSSGWSLQGQLGESGLLLRVCKTLDPKSLDA